ncbi:MAG: hypothetical protein EB168_11155 [Euryarchaeota archaeon]|nr:hypothetical protein [Euryarchaeota archaeon]
MTNLKALTTLLAGGVITQSEFDRFEKRVSRAQAKAAEQAEIQALVQPLREFMEADVQYKISDLVLGVLGIKAPCHGYKETKEEQKHRDGVAKPRIIGALEILGASKYGSGAQTRYSFGEAAPEFETNAGDEEESAES